MRQLLRRIRRPTETLHGYDHVELVDLVFRKTVAFQASGEWVEMRGVSTVLDFGGGCGLHYRQAQSSSVRWAVVETAAMIERAKQLETDKLRFFVSVPDAADWLGNVEVMHSNGALQYTPDPLTIVGQLCAIRAERMIWDRLLFGEGVETQSSFLNDNGPGKFLIKEKIVKYNRTRISENAFVAAHSGYAVTSRGADCFRFTRSQP